MNSILKSCVVAVILAFAMILSSIFLSKFFVRIRHEQSIRVKGFAERDVVSDLGKLRCTFSGRDATLQGAYDKLEQSRAAVLAYLKNAGFGDAEIQLDVVGTRRVMKRNEQGKEMNEIEYYDTSQDIQVTSTNVNLIQSAAVGLADLIKEGFEIGVGAPEYYVLNLKDLKLALLSEATRDAHQRATTLASHSGGSVGKLISAQQGIFQITARNSMSISDYGEYNTESVEKTVKAVVTLEYEIKNASHLSK